MKYFKFTKLCAIAAMLAVSACGGQPGDSNTEEAVKQAASQGPVVENVIKSRQGQLKELGGTFRAINKELRAGSPNLETVKASADKLPGIIQGMETWFPEGSGPEAGIKTEALATIWETPADFNDKVDGLETAVANLVNAAGTGDLANIKTAVREMGGSCKACHDKYRLDD